jgi:hypothetical protein
MDVSDFGAISMLTQLTRLEMHSCRTNSRAALIHAVSVLSRLRRFALILMQLQGGARQLVIEGSAAVSILPCLSQLESLSITVFPDWLERCLTSLVPIASQLRALELQMEPSETEMEEHYGALSLLKELTALRDLYVRISFFCSVRLPNPLIACSRPLMFH